MGRDKILAFLFFIFLSSNGISQIKMPYTFKNGDIVNANEINANFEHINGFNVEVRSKGIGIGKTHSSYLDGLGVAQIIDVLLDFGGHKVKIKKDGSIEGYRQLYFFESDCSGTAYIRLDSCVGCDATHFFFETDGEVFYANGGVYYTKKDDDYFYGKPAYKSHFDIYGHISQPPLSCSPTHPFEILMKKAYPNNPAITGVMGGVIPNLEVVGFTQKSLIKVP